MVEETRADLNGDDSFKLGGHLGNYSLSNLHNPHDEMMRFKDVRWEPRYMIMTGKDGNAIKIHLVGDRDHRNPTSTRSFDKSHSPLRNPISTRSYDKLKGHHRDPISTRSFDKLQSPKEEEK